MITNQVSKEKREELAVKVMSMALAKEHIACVKNSAANVEEANAYMSERFKIKDFFTVDKKAKK